MKSNLFQIEAAKAAAKRLYQKVNYAAGPLESYQVANLLSQTYEYLKIPFNPSTRDVKAYSDILDVNKDGQVTLSDLQNLAVQYLVGEGVLGNKTQSSINLIKSTKQVQIKQDYHAQMDYQSDSPCTEEGLYYLQKTRQIFQYYAGEHFTITSDTVPNLLSQTYELLGRKGYVANEQDVRVWMKLCDGNADGHVEYEEFEHFVVRSLERQGIRVFK